MRILALCLAQLAAAPPAATGDDLPGRWQGLVHVPGMDVHVTADIDRGAGGALIGSITAPELYLQGVPLAAIERHGDAVAFTIKGALANSPDQPAKFDGRIDAGTLAGSFTQAGNAAGFELRRTGAAAVELPPASTAVARELEGSWTGDYELMGYTRHVTVRFANHAGKPASVGFVIVGKKTTDLPVDYVSQDGDFIRIESHEIGINLDARLRRDAGEMDATYQQGPFEVPFVLRRAAAEKKS